MNLTTNNKCSRCGQCCNPNNPITLEEYYIIKDYIKKNNIKPHRVRPDKDGNVYLTCVFNDTENKCCTIYPVRPKVCRNYICSRNPLRIEIDKRIYDKRADINGCHIDRFIPFDLLFYDDIATTIYILFNLFGITSKDALIKKLIALGSDQKFLTEHNLTNTMQIAEAILRGDLFRKEW